MKKYSAAVTVALVSILGLVQAACQETPVVSEERTSLRVATAFGPFTRPLADQYTQRLPYLNVSMQEAMDSEAVIAGIEDGSVDLGISYADVAYSAYWGPDGRARSSRVRGVLLLLPLPQYLLVRGDSGIHHVADLQGRTVWVGPRTSGSWKLAHFVLEAFGIRPAAVHSEMTRAEGAAGLKDGSLDAIFLPGYVYPDDVMHGAIQDGAYFVPIDGPVVERLRQERPFIRKAAIPRGVYPGQDRIIPTVGIDMVVVCQRDLDPSVVYDLTAALLNAYPQLSGVEATLRFLNPDEAAATPIPLHPGATRYFRERELSR